MGENLTLTPPPSEVVKHTLPPKTNPDIVDQPIAISLTERLSKIKASSQESLHRINTLLNGESMEQTNEVEAAPVDPQFLLEDLIDNSQALTPAEYMRKSKVALGSSSSLKQQFNTDKETLENTKSQLSNANQRIEDRLEQLGSKGFTKFFSYFERKHLNTQKVSVQQEAEVAGNQIQEKKDSLAQIQEREKIIKEQQEKLISAEIYQTVGNIKNGYEQLLQEVLQDEVISSEIRTAYINQNIEPELQILVKSKRMTNDEKNQFYQILNTYLDQRNSRSQEGEKQPNKEELNKWLNKGFFVGVRQIWHGFIEDRQDTLIFKKLAAKLAAEDITSIMVLLSPGLYNYQWESSQKYLRKMVEAIEQVDKPNIDRNKTLIGKQILSVLNRSNDENYPDIRVWHAIKDSSTINELFDSSIKAEDDRIFNMVLEKSLTDQEGRDINLLRYYPRPEAIRNLIILAAADYKNFRTYSANRVLKDLTERQDWNKILDRAEQQYPSLKIGRSFLEHWNHIEYSNNPEVQEVFSDFILDIYESESNPILKELAKEALPNVSILTLLTKRGVLSKQEQNILLEVGTLLKQINEEINKRQKVDDHSIPYIYEKFFRDGLRKSLSTLLEPGTKDQDDQKITIIKRFEALSQSILENKTNYPVLGYLTDSLVIEKIKNPSFNSDLLPIFLTAYQNCPALIDKNYLLDNNLSTNSSFLSEFVGQFEGEQTVRFFRDMSVAYKNHIQQLNKILDLVGEGVLSRERALELPAKAADVLTSTQFSLAENFPQLFLETDDGVEFFSQITTASLFSLDKGLDTRIGEIIRNLQKDDTLYFPILVNNTASHEIEQIDKLLSSETPIEANSQNWQQLLMGYIRAHSDVVDFSNLSKASSDKIDILFNNPKVRDLCLDSMRNSWLTYLKSGNPQQVPFSLNFMSEFINYCGGAGPLSQIESLNSLIRTTNNAFLRETTIDRTKKEINQGLVNIEERFTKERWSNENKTDFYNISREIIGATPSLFTDFIALFDKLTPSQLSMFTKDIYPLFRTKLVLIEKTNEKGDKTFDIKQLLLIRKDIRNLANTFNTVEKSFGNQKQKLLEDISEVFKERFGIVKVPQEFSQEQLRSLTNISTYLANLNGRNLNKETILGFYMSLMINGRWDNFRKGETIDSSEFLTPEKSNIINKILEERQQLNPLVPNELGISSAEIPEFFELLQQETQNIVIGNIETIDVKLTNIVLNLQGLEDLDLYPNALDKQRMQLLINFGNKKVGSVVAKMYQSLTTPEKQFELSEEDIKVQQQITHIIQQLGLNLTPQTLKEHFQDGVKPFSTVVNLLQFVKDSQAEQQIEDLRSLLKPSQDVIEIFKRLGEDFKPTSGAMALSQDLSYLDNLIVKNDDKLQPQEKTLLTEYTTSIREQIIKLESVYNQIKNKFGSMKQGSNPSGNPLLRDKLDQIDRIVNTQTTQQIITSTATNNLNVIIENIRECLACIRQGCNNDTDLTFGDINKFYLYSQSETQQTGSISDQLLFVEPITRADGSKEVAFVLDRIYGTSTPTILDNHIETVLKKYRLIKQRFPNIKLSVFISDAAISTGGISEEMLIERLKSRNITSEKESLEVDVAKSAVEDHYIEFGGGARIAGKRQVNGIVIQ